MSTGAPNRRLIVLEGAEGAGKSTQVARLADWLARRDVPVRVVREPGTSAVGTEIRRLLLEPRHAIDPAAEALLFMAARAQLVAEELAPALDAGETVLADRFFLSTYAYQVHGRGLMESQVRAANALATRGRVPDLTVLITVPADEGLARARARGGHDRMEQAGEQFHRRVGEAFASFADPSWQAAHPECGPIVVVDGTLNEAAVFARTLEHVVARWPALRADAAELDGPA